MKGDFSRNTFNAGKHFKGVYMQQGRVQLDADWNENLDILMHRIETETKDVIGLCGVPIHAAGFGVVGDPKLLSDKEQEILTEKGLLPLEAGDFLLTAGRAYVDGILCELEKTILFSQQPYVLPKGGKLPPSGTYAVYLDVWERLITTLEDPSIREVALGGPDTATRSQVVWQVKFVPAGSAESAKTGADIDCSDPIDGWPPTSSTGKLCARTTPVKKPEDPCAVVPGAGYKRLENQLYRVEIHAGSNSETGPTYKWSRDNGSVVVRVEEFSVDGSAAKVRVSSLGRDDVLGLHELDWVEVLDDATELTGKPGQMVQIDKIDRERLIVTLKQSVSGFDVNGHAKLRRWDSAGALKVEVPAENGGYVQIDDAGVEIKFDLGLFHTGDYWTIPARTVPGQYGDIEWPKEGANPACLLPFGIEHHYCKLAIVTLSDGIFTEIQDCRKKFPPLTELPTGGECCCSVTVGDGGDYTDIQEAVDARPADAKFWNVCLLPGLHKLQKPVFIQEQSGLAISGCSDQTLVEGGDGVPLFVATRMINLRFEGLMLKANSPQGVIVIGGSRGVMVQRCRGKNTFEPQLDHEARKLLVPGPIVVVLKSEDVEVRENIFNGQPAVIAQSQSLRILDNLFTGGGVQVLFGSSEVHIEENSIIKGFGAGIQLGGVFALDEDSFGMIRAEMKIASDAVRVEHQTQYTEYQEATTLEVVREIKLVTIANNLIGGMEGSGIITADNLGKEDALGEVSYLTIANNQIIKNVKQPDVILSDKSRVGGGIALLGISDASIHDNLVTANGGRNVPACGIAFVNGSNVDISGNVVTDNGTAEIDADPLSYQAGIVALYVAGNGITFLEVLAHDKSDFRQGTPALRVHGNEVTMPSGPALNIVALGTVSIANNCFTTRALRRQQPLIPDYDDNAAAVMVFNVGHQTWMSGVTFGDGKFHIELAKGVKSVSTSKSMPDGRIQFHDNQVTIGFPERDPETYKPIMVPGGVTLISFDDVSMQGNQVITDVTPDYLFADVGCIGATVRTIGNNFSEPAGSSLLSHLGAAMLMNTTTSNQAVHCILAVAPQTVETNNMVMFASGLCNRLVDILSVARKAG